ncbi:hypothetical protein F4780DRAFT_59059 [Xylariomycetidae sp. FL0641]|nr:hypothetical protein F4780DRAFT_59059 [Xylariomycetidae sp. FL0641]
MWAGQDPGSPVFPVFPVFPVPVLAGTLPKVVPLPSKPSQVLTPPQSPHLLLPPTRDRCGCPLDGQNSSMEYGCIARPDPPRPPSSVKAYLRARLSRGSGGGGMDRQTVQQEDGTRPCQPEDRTSPSDPHKPITGAP